MDQKKLESTWKSFLKTRSKKTKSLLVEHYFPYVQIIAHEQSKKYNYKITADELASYGVEGLMRAINKFDPSKYSNKFETYANMRIKGSMIDGLRAEDFVPRSVRQKSDKIDGVRRRLENELGRTPTEEEIFNELGFDIEEFYKHPNRFKAAGKSSIESCIDPEIGSDNKIDFNDSLSDDNPMPEEISIRREFFSKLVSEFKLTQTESKIIYFYYYDKLTMRQISKKLDISESRISQIHQKILGKIRSKVKNSEYFEEGLFSEIEGFKANNPIF